MSRCVDCEFLAGSERTPQWLFARGQGYCDHPNRAGGKWNVLRSVVTGYHCDNFKQADKDRIKQRIKALDILSKRARHV